jgi:hypothetical protein
MRYKSVGGFVGVVFWSELALHGKPQYGIFQLLRAEVLSCRIDFKSISKSDRNNLS